jgi:hypothetical protein
MWFKSVPKLHSSSVSWEILSDVLIHWKQNYNYVHHSQLLWWKKNVRIIWTNNRPCTIVTSTHSSMNACDLGPWSATSSTHDPILLTTFRGGPQPITLAPITCINCTLLVTGLAVGGLQRWLSEIKVNQLLWLPYVGIPRPCLWMQGGHTWGPNSSHCWNGHMY